MDFVYICRSGENEELRYSIRSIVKNTDVKNIWIFGDKPDWYDGNFVYVNPDPNKFKNTQKCLKEICSTKQISDDFILMNDDFYITKYISNIPYYHGGSMYDKIENYMSIYGSNQYSRLLAFAANKMKKHKIEDPLDYELHVPMKMNKNNLIKILDYSLSPRSFYGNYFNVGGIQIEDVKIRKHGDTVKDIGFISTEDDSFLLIKERLQELFPEPSKYEKY